MIDINLAHFLFGLVGMLIGALGMLLFMLKYFVSRSYCEQAMASCKAVRNQRESFDEHSFTELKTEIADIKEMLGRLFSVLELTPDQRLAVSKRK